MTLSREDRELLSLPWAKSLRQLAQEHWQEHRPRMFRRLQASGELKSALENAVLKTLKAQERVKAQLREQNPPPRSENPLELTKYHNWVKQTSWELVREEWILLPTEEDAPNCS